MSDIKLEANNDVSVADGDYIIITGKDAVAQHLKLRLQSERLIGIFRGNLDKTVPDSLIRLRFRRLIADTPGVSKIVTYDTSRTGRTFEIQAQIEIDDGQRFFFTYSTADEVQDEEAV